MKEAFADPENVAFANFFLLRNLLKYLYISGKFKDGELSSLLEGSISAAEASGKLEAAEILRGLRYDLGAYEL